MKENKVIFTRHFDGLFDGTTDFTVNVLQPPACKVYLISHGTDPEQTLAKVTHTYNGTMQHEDFSEEEVEKSFVDVQKTKLKDPVSMLHTVFLFRGVTRAFTHQLVRYRIATAFAQESMRFYGVKGEYNVLATGKLLRNENALHMYTDACTRSIRCYHDAVELYGIPSEDARGILPTNILTSIFFDANMLTWQNIFTQRFCCQAQHPEWLPLLMQVRTIIRETMGDRVADLLKAPVELGKPCGYNASFDRPCVWKNGIKTEYTDEGSGRNTDEA